MEVSSLISQMLPFKNRLKKGKEIERVFKDGKTFKEDLIVLKKIENFLENSRFCFIVSEKVSRRTTVRNKIKRRMREIVRESLPKIKNGLDVILIALPGIERKSFLEMKKDLLRVLFKARILK